MLPRYIHPMPELDIRPFIKSSMIQSEKDIQNVLYDLNRNPRSVVIPQDYIDFKRALKQNKNYKMPYDFDRMKQKHFGAFSGFAPNVIPQTSQNNLGYPLGRYLFERARERHGFTGSNLRTSLTFTQDAFSFGPLFGRLLGDMSPYQTKIIQNGINQKSGRVINDIVLGRNDLNQEHLSSIGESLFNMYTGVAISEVKTSAALMGGKLKSATKGLVVVGKEGMNFYDAKINHAGLFSLVNLKLGNSVPVFPSSISMLEGLGYKNQNNSLETLLESLQDNFRTEIRDGQLIAYAKKGRGRQKGVSIPLFSSSLHAGTKGAAAKMGAESGYLAGAITGEYMFRSGGVSSVSPLITKVGKSVDNQFLLENPISFSQHFYKQLTDSLTGVKTSKVLKKNIADVLQAQSVFFAPEAGLERSALDSAGYTDPLQYAGRQKLGRHHFTTSNTILVDVTEHEEIMELMKEEYARRREFATGIARGKDRTDAPKMRKASRAAKEAVLEHVRTMGGKSKEHKDLFNRLNFAAASQSGEWLFHDTTNTVNANRPGARTYIKMTTAAPEDLVFLPSETVYRKGVHFFASSGPVTATSINEIPAAVSPITSYTSNAMKRLRSDAVALRKASGVQKLSRAQRNLPSGPPIGETLNLRGIGIQFLDPELNEAIFGDSAAYMSRNLMTTLDTDPITGHSRRTITSKIALLKNTSAGDTTSFTGVLRGDLAAAIRAHAQRKDNTGTILFSPGHEIALNAHSELQSAVAMGLSPDGKVVVGDRLKEVDNVVLDDLKRLNDVLRDVRSRGMDPDNVFITGVRLIEGSEQLELIMSERDSVLADPGYIFNQRRFALSGALSEENKQKLFSQLNITGRDKDLGLVIGDIGIGRTSKGAKKGKVSYGFNATLMGNLAEIISRKESAKPASEQLGAKALTDALGGSFDVINIGGNKRIQFKGLGSTLKYVSTSPGFGEKGDKQFLSAFAGALETIAEVPGYSNIRQQLQKETFVEADITEVLQHIPGYKKIIESYRERNQDSSPKHQLINLLDQLGFTETKKKISASSSSLESIPLIRAMGGLISVRDEEPVFKSGAGSLNIKTREVLMIGESIDFALNGGMSREATSKAKADFFKSFIDDNPRLMKKSGELSTLYQMSGGPFKPESAASEIMEVFKDKEIGQLGILTSQGDTVLVDSLDRKSTIGDLGKIISKPGFEGKLPLSELGDTILGVVGDDGVAKISDQALLVQGPNGPMMIPSPALMGFEVEKGFVRIPGGTNDPKDLHNIIKAKLAKGESVVKEAKSLYLNVLSEVEKIENARLSADRQELSGGLSEIGSKLQQLLATNTLAKQGMYYNSSLSKRTMAMSGTFRLTTNPLVGTHEVGLTETGLRSMLTGGQYEEFINYHKQGKKKAPDLPGLSGSNSIDKILQRAKDGDLLLQAYREPAASGRQFHSMRVKILDPEDIASAEGVDFDNSAFLHKATTKYLMEGDHDKDQVSLFRITSIDDNTLQSIHKGQVNQMHKIIQQFDGSPDLLASPNGNEIRNVREAMGMIQQMQHGGTNQGQLLSPRDETFEAFADLVEPKHATPLTEAHFAGRSFVDQMIGQVLDVQTASGQKNMLMDELIGRFDERQQGQVQEILGVYTKLFNTDSAGSAKGRFATYNYTDMRNVIKYLHLKKVANQDVGKQGAGESYSLLKLASESFIAADDNARVAYLQTLGDAGESKHALAREHIDHLSQTILEIATGNQDKTIQEMATVLPAEMVPETFSLLQVQGSRAERAELLARRAIAAELMTTMQRGTPGGISGEGIIKNLNTVFGRIENEFGIQGRSPEAMSAAAMQDLQMMTSDPEYVNEFNPARVIEQHEQLKRAQVQASQLRGGSNLNAAQDVVSAAVDGGGVPTAGRQQIQNAFTSSEFFKKITKGKYFKPAAAIVGGLAGLEVIRSAIDRFAPGNVPAGFNSSASAMAPMPLMSSPNDPTFAPDAMPNTNVVRLNKNAGQKSSVNVSGKMDSPVDFRGITNQVSLNNGYIPNIHGSFRSDINDTMFREDANGYLNDRMNATF